MAFIDSFEGHHADSLQDFTSSMVFLDDDVGLDLQEVAIPMTPEKPTNHSSHLHVEDGLLNFTPDDGLLNFMNEFGLSNFTGDDMLLNFMEEDCLPIVSDVLGVVSEHVDMANDHGCVASDIMANGDFSLSHDDMVVAHKDIVGVANVNMGVAKDIVVVVNNDTGVIKDIVDVVKDGTGVANNIVGVAVTRTDVAVDQKFVANDVVSEVNDDLCVPIDDMGLAGIEASDVGSLLEQFEEVSQAFVAESPAPVPDIGEETSTPTVETSHSAVSDVAASVTHIAAVKRAEVKLAISAPVVTFIERNPAIAAMGDTTAAAVPDRGEIKSVISSGILATSTLTVVGIEEIETACTGEGELATSEPTVVEMGESESPTMDLESALGLSKMRGQEMMDRNGNLIAILDPEDNCLEKLQKLKSSIKRKTTVMLPMAVPAKRGRGRGRAMARGHPVPMPANCAPLRLQRVMMQNKELRDSIPLVAPEIDATPKKKGKSNDKVNVDDNYFELANDHDYCTNGTTVAVAGEVLYEDGNNNLKFTDINCGVASDGSLEKFKKVDNDQQQNKRSYRRQHGSPEVDTTQYFDKLPSYYTALSIPQKSIKKSASTVTLTSNNSVHDLIERDHSPVRDPSMYNKLPDYHSSFTNSARYEASDTVCDFSLESKISSGYSSRSTSPLVIDSQRASRSVSSAGSRSSSSCCSDCSCLDGSRSKSHESRGSQGRPRSLESRSRSRSRSYSSCSSHYSSRSPDRAWKRELKMRHSRHSRSRHRRSSSRGPYRDSRSRSPSYSRAPGRNCDRYSRQPHSPSYHSKSRSRRYRSRSRSHGYGSRPRSRGYRSRSRSWSRGRSYTRAPRTRQSDARQKHHDFMEQQSGTDKIKQNEQRRIMYVGNLPNNYTRKRLRQRFERFGDIEHVQLHFREHGDNYGFVTFQYTCDAYAAIEKGNSIGGELKFDLCFGGRRQFCDVDYADLDGNKEIEEEYELAPLTGSAPLDFDQLLKQAQKKIKKS